MRILHLVETLERGGLERIVVDLARAQQEAGHDVAVCCLFRAGTLAPELRAAGIDVISAGKRKGPDVRAVWRVRRALVAHRADVLHTHNYVANYYGALAVPIAAAARLVNTRHGMAFVRRERRRERLFRVSLLRTAVVTVVCESTRDYVIANRIVPRRLALVVPSGIRVDAFAHGSAVARTAARERLGVPAEAFVVGTVGRLVDDKDHALLIDAFARLTVLRPHARLVVVGDGERRGALATQIARLGVRTAVLLTGDRDDVPALLPAFDVFAMTSRNESYSIALLEAAAAGLPAVASDAGGNREIVQDGSTGLVVTDRTPEVFARAFENLADAPEVCARMGAQARRWVEEHGSVEAMARRYEAAYAGARDDDAAHGRNV
jgi:glycosyltransferase involved in cell wall biosynthesis